MCGVRGVSGEADDQGDEDGHLQRGDVTLEPVTSTAINDEVAAAYSAKYRSQPGALRPMLENTAADTTVRLLADDT